MLGARRWHGCQDYRHCRRQGQQRQRLQRRLLLLRLPPLLGRIKRLREPCMQALPRAHLHRDLPWRGRLSRWGRLLHRGILQRRRLRIDRCWSTHRASRSKTFLSFTCSLSCAGGLDTMRRQFGCHCGGACRPQCCAGSLGLVVRQSTTSSARTHAFARRIKARIRRSAQPRSAYGGGFLLVQREADLFSRLNMVRNVIIEENDKIIGKILPDIQSANVAQMYLAIGEYQVSAVRCARKNTRRRTCQFSVGRSVCDS